MFSNFCCFALTSFKEWRTKEFSLQDIEELRPSLQWKKDISEVLNSIHFKYRADTIPALEQLWKNHEGDIGEAREVFQVIILIYSPNFQGNERVWGHPLWSQRAISYAATFREVYGENTKVIFFDLWSDATLVWNTSHWPAGIKLCSRNEVKHVN